MRDFYGEKIILVVVSVAGHLGSIKINRFVLIDFTTRMIFSDRHRNTVKKNERQSRTRLNFKLKRVM